MTNRRNLCGIARRVVLAAGVALGASVTAGAVFAAETIDPDADKILRSMSDYLGGLPSFSAKADVDNEIIDMAGQKLQLSSSASVLVERPARLHATRHGPLIDAEVIYDGKSTTTFATEFAPSSPQEAKQLASLALEKGDLDKALIISSRCLTWMTRILMHYSISRRSIPIATIVGWQLLLTSGHCRLNPTIHAPLPVSASS